MAESRSEPWLTERCDICGGEMVEVHCKLICFNCGYTRDCGDQ